MKTVLLFTSLFTAVAVWGQEYLQPGIPPEAVQAVTITPSTRNKDSSQVTSNSASGLAPSLDQRIYSAPGGGRVDSGLQKTFFPGDVKAEPVVITAPDGRRLSFRATFIALHDKQSGQNLLLAEVTNRIGTIVADDEVMYTNAFDSLAASVRYRVLGNGNGLEQDIVFEEFVEIPKGFAPESSQIEIWTEWFNSEPVSKSKQAIDLRANEPSGLLPASLLDDEGLDFGTMKIVTGHAFSSTAQDERTPVAKAWLRIDGRVWLVETVDYLAVKSKLDLLLKARRTASLNRSSGPREQMIRSLARNSTPLPGKPARMLMAQAIPSRLPQFVMDFIIVSSVPVPSDAVSWWPAGGDTNDAISNQSRHAVQRRHLCGGQGRPGLQV